MTFREGNCPSGVFDGNFWSGQSCTTSFECYVEDLPEGFNFWECQIPGQSDVNCCVAIYLEEGCTDPDAINYNPDAVFDDGSCLYPDDEEIFGCTDPNAINYNPEATLNDGSCEYENDGLFSLVYIRPWSGIRFRY